MSPGIVTTKNKEQYETNRSNGYGKECGVQVEHYIISSGLREIIEGSSIYKKFKEVYACEFMYDENDTACWPKNVVNYMAEANYKAGSELDKLVKEVVSEIAAKDKLMRLHVKQRKSVGEKL